MLKKIVPLVIIVGLLAYGVYDFWQSQQTTLPQEATAEQTEQTAKSATGASGKSSDSHQSESSKAKNVEVGLGIGDRAPNFTLTTMQGRKVSLKDYRGQKVLLNFWATWCPPCRVEVPHLQNYYEAHKDDDFVILAVNMTNTEKSLDNVRAFINQYGMTFPVLLDEKGLVATGYNVIAYPTSYFINKQGIITSTVRGPMNEYAIKQMMKRMKHY